MLHSNRSFAITCCMLPNNNGDFDMIDKIKSQDDTTNLSLITNSDTMLKYSELIDDVVEYSKGDLSVRITKTVPDDIWTEVNAQ
mmetsp:Transcript_4746/g.10106  ORF Transcript_4746/g.10106 Transcript_4746/m.10106 type:complete len:84 (+) Transcript_4746:288-539(+)